jgi:N-acylneuraminate cytidylyltransferase
MKVAIIPARGGSKRIPKKNIKLFHGKPIISYSIEAALDSKCFDRVIVSTDDESIAKVAQKYGAEVPFIRPAEFSDDYTGTNAVVAHAINTLNCEVELACCIYATAPFVTVATLQQGYVKLINTSSAEFAVTVTSFPFPIQRAVTLDENTGCLSMNDTSLRLTRSQDLTEMYHDAGQIYWGRANAFIENRPLFTANTTPIILPRHRVQDIDTPEDWLRAEMLYRVWVEQGQP